MPTAAQEFTHLQETLFSCMSRYIAGFGLVEMAISTNPKPVIYRDVHIIQAQPIVWKAHYCYLRWINYRHTTQDVHSLFNNGSPKTIIMK